jgi:hypothetical protein
MVTGPFVTPGRRADKSITARSSFFHSESYPFQVSVSEPHNSNSTQLLCEPDGLGKLEIKLLVKT